MPKPASPYPPVRPGRIDTCHSNADTIDPQWAYWFDPNLEILGWLCASGRLQPAEQLLSRRLTKEILLWVLAESKQQE